MQIRRDQTHQPPGVGTLMYVGDEVTSFVNPVTATVGAAFLAYALFGPKRTRTAAALTGAALIVLLAPEDRA